MDNMVNIRGIDTAEYDIAFLLIRRVFMDCVQQDYAEEGTAYFLKHFVAPDSEYRQKVEAGQETVFGAYDDDRLIGVITVSEHGNISCAFVEKAYQRQGIGRMLFWHAKEVIEKSHTLPHEIKLNASPYAVPFYEALGFQKTGEQAEYHGMIYIPMALEVQ